MIWLVLILLVLVLAVVFLVRPVRRALVTRSIMPALARTLPRMGETERIALEAGTVWWEAELFSGRPRWRKLLDFQSLKLTERERAFLDGPVNELCRMVNEWDIIQRGDLPGEAWEHLKKH